MISFEHWSKRECDREICYERAESPFRFCVEDDTWICDYDQMHISGFGDSPEEALQECLEQMEEAKILLDAAIMVGGDLKSTGRI